MPNDTFRERKGGRERGTLISCFSHASPSQPPETQPATSQFTGWGPNELSHTRQGAFTRCWWSHRPFLVLFFLISFASQIKAQNSGASTVCSPWSWSMSCPRLQHLNGGFRTSSVAVYGTVDIVSGPGQHHHRQDSCFQWMGQSWWVKTSVSHAILIHIRYREKRIQCANKFMKDCILYPFSKIQVCTAQCKALWHSTVKKSVHTLCLAQNQWFSAH